MAGEAGALIERLNPTCRRALEEAAGLCVGQTHFNVEVEHFLLKLLDSEDSDITLILSNYDIDRDRALDELTRALESFKRGNSRTPTLSPQLTSLLQEAWLESSIPRDDSMIRSGSVLLALLKDDTLRPTIVVESCPVLAGLSITALEEDFDSLLNASKEDPGGGQVTPGKKASGRAGARTKRVSGALDQFTIDLSAEAEEGKIDPIRGRSREIRSLIDVLTRRRQNNPILVGEAGVGKTAVVEGLALRIASGDVAKSLRDVELRILDLGLLQAGAGIKGEFEDRLKRVIAEVKEADHPIILFVDEAHALIGAGGMAGQGDAANLLKPALARGELRTIAATTWSEYKKYIEKDPALARRFQLIKVDEPDEEAAIDMLRGIAVRLADHHGVTILDQAVEEAVRLSTRYLPDRRLPDKSIGVLDTACARVALAREIRPPALEDLDRRLQPVELQVEALDREAEKALSRSGGEDARQGLRKQLADLCEERTKLEERWRSELDLVQEIGKLSSDLATAKSKEKKDQQGKLDKLLKQLEEAQEGGRMVPLFVDSEVVATVISGWTGVPVGRMQGDQLREVLTLEDAMEGRIIGQPHAIRTLCKQISTSRAKLGDPRKPQGVLLLVGPSGVGKTETALALSDILYGGADNLASFNMSEFQEAHSVSTLKGSPPGYVGYGEGGALTEAIRRRPYSVLLLDEFEKAHTDVLELFYQVFDKGILEDAEGVSVDFKQTIVLLTTNVGAEILLEACADDKNEKTAEELVDLLRPALARHFPAALLGRLTIVPYLPLGSEEILKIAELKLAKIQEQFKQSHRAELSYDDKVRQRVVDGCAYSDTGARDIDAILDQTLLPQLSTALLSRMADGKGFKSVHVTVEEPSGFILDISN